MVVHNDGDCELLGRPVGVKVGAGHGTAVLSGAAAEAVRVCNEQGVEMLFDVVGPDGESVVVGPIQEGSSIVIPAECPPKSTAVYYVYFDNPSAGQVPDFLEARFRLTNGDMERGNGLEPTGWKHDTGAQQHHASWSTENPQSGRRCLKTVVAEGAEPTWIATRQRDITVVGGAKYRVQAWVKAENVKGHAGWYVHVGNREKPMMLAPSLNAGDGTYDWKQLTAEFTVPADADQLSLGTVLRGTGTAWFDDFRLVEGVSSEVVLYTRWFLNALVMVRPSLAAAGWGDDTAIEHDLDGAYRPLQPDGALGESVQTIRLRLGEAAILIP